MTTRDASLSGARLDLPALREQARALAERHEAASAVDGAGAVVPSLESLARLLDAPPDRSGLGSLVHELVWAQHRFLEEHADRLAERARTGHVRSLDGQARDTALDVAATALDLAARGFPDRAERFLSAYAGAADDFGLYRVVDYHERALALADYERDPDDVEALRPRLAAALATRGRLLLPPVVVAVGGPVACGKSTLAQGVAEQMGAPRIETDRVRDFLLGDRPGRTVHEARWAESLAPDFPERVYHEMLRRAEWVLESGRPLVVDACFPEMRHRLALRQLARRFGRPFLFVECAVDADTARERLAARDAADGGGWTRIAEDLAARWEPVKGLLPGEHVRIDTGRTHEACLHDLEARLPTWPSGFELHASGAAPGNDEPIRAEAVTFDCWNTLLVEQDWQAAHGLRVAALARAAAEAGRSVSDAEVARAFDAAWERHMQLWSEEVATGAPEIALWALDELGLHEPHPALEHLVTQWQGASHTSRVEALPGARDLLAALADAGVRRALVCDTGLTPGRVVRQHLERAGLLEHLEVQVFSDEVGVPKPEARVFRSALAPLGVAPERALHVGDLRRTDVAGARRLGMASVRLSVPHDDATRLPDADHVVASHAELGRLLGLRSAS